MSKIELPSIANPSNASLMNNNFKKIEDVLNEEVLYRKNYVGEPNEMQTNLDMNGKEILNVSVGSSPESLATKGYVDQEISEERVYVDQQLTEVDLALSGKFDKTGGPISGPVQMSGNSISGLPNATQLSEPATYDQLLKVESAEDSLVRAALKSFSGTLEEVASWANIPKHSDEDLGDELDAQAKALAARSELLKARGDGYLYDQIRAYTGGETRLSCIGRTSVFDGANGEFVLSPSSSAVDDDATVLIDALGRRWLRIMQGEVCPEWWGALGGVEDDGVAINKAIAFAEGKRFSVYFQFDSYLTSIPLVVKTGAGLTIRGRNKNRTTITKTALTAPNVTRTYNGTDVNYDVPCIFALIADNESYVRHLCMSDINLNGLGNDITQTHIFAPRVTYSVWWNIVSTSGKSFFESKIGGFVNTFINCRTALMAVHWDVDTSNSYSLYNTYANGTISGSESIGYRFKDTNVNFHGCDTDGLNIGYLALGCAKMSLFGCNTESRLRQVNARDNAVIDVHGGRFALTLIGSQASTSAACFWAEGAGRIDVYSVKAHKYDFTGGVATNKALAVASGSSSIALNDIELDITGVAGAVAFTEADITSTTDGKVELLRAGKTINFVANHRPATDFGITAAKQIRKSLDFATGLTQTLLTISGADYNEVMIADISLMYRSTGNNGNGSVSGSTQLKVTGSNRNTATVNLQQAGSQLCPDGLSNTIVFATSIVAGVITVTATASVATVGACSCLIDAKGMVVMANGEADAISIA